MSLQEIAKLSESARELAKDAMQREMIALQDELSLELDLAQRDWVCVLCVCCVCVCVCVGVCVCLHAHTVCLCVCVCVCVCICVCV